MNGYTLDSIRFETQAHMDRRVHDAASERLARQLRGDAVRKPLAGLRWLERIQPGWATRLVRPSARPVVRAA